MSDRTILSVVLYLVLLVFCYAVSLVSGNDIPDWAFVAIWLAARIEAIAITDEEFER